MNLVVDASVLVGEVLRSRGLALLGHSGLMLFQPEHAAGETAHELRRRTDRMAHSGRTTPQQAIALLENALQFAASNVMILAHEDYSSHEAEARRRIPRDPNDWSLVPLALHLGEVPILTTDGDFLGCGLPTWGSKACWRPVARDLQGGGWPLQKADFSVPDNLPSIPFWWAKR